MKIQRLSDEAILAQLGDALRERRLRSEVTQDVLAERVGVSTPTIQKLEKGKGTLQLLVAVLRELKSLDLLNDLTSPPRVSPLAVARSGKTSRQRAAASSASKTRIVMGKLSPKAEKHSGQVLLIPRKKSV
jgi:transcriptional regulator with XRE-family HTH domain